MLRSYGRWIILIGLLVALKGQAFALKDQANPLYGRETEKTRIGESGNPIPRFVALDTDVANLRTGPGRQYPIDWVYQRPGWPFMVTDEEGAWRKLIDHDGIEGWMHVSLLTSRARTALITGQTRTLHKNAEATSKATLLADEGVIGRIMACRGLWCELRIGSIRAWIERRYIWGVFRDEDF